MTYQITERVWSNDIPHAAKSCLKLTKNLTLNKPEIPLQLLFDDIKAFHHAMCNADLVNILSTGKIYIFITLLRYLYLTM